MKSNPRRLQTAALTTALPAIDQALIVIREQYLRLDADERQILRRIVRKIERLDAALADLHLVLPTIEIAFYGVRAGRDTRHGLSARDLRHMMRTWESISGAEAP